MAPNSQFLWKKNLQEMAPKPAQDLVRSLHRQGKSSEEIRQKLKDDGYSKSRISQLMAGWASQRNQSQAFEKAREEKGLPDDQIQSQSEEDEDRDAKKKKSRRKNKKKGKKKRSSSVSSSLSPMPKRCCEPSDSAQPTNTTSKEDGCAMKSYAEI